MVRTIVPLHQRPQDRACREQDEGDLDGELGVEVPLFPVEPVLLKHHHYGESEAAEEDPQHQRNKDPQVGFVGDDAIGMRRESSVVERGNRIKDAVPHGLPEVFAEHDEARNERQRQGRLNHH